MVNELPLFPLLPLQTTAVPLTFEEIATVIGTPLQIVCETGTAVRTGLGLTVTGTVIVAPEQPLKRELIV